MRTIVSARVPILTSGASAPTFSVAPAPSGQRCGQRVRRHARRCRVARWSQRQSACRAASAGPTCRSRQRMARNRRCARLAQRRCRTEHRRPRRRPTRRPGIHARRQIAGAMGLLQRLGEHGIGATEGKPSRVDCGGALPSRLGSQIDTDHGESGSAIVVPRLGDGGCHGCADEAETLDTDDRTVRGQASEIQRLRDETALVCRLVHHHAVTPCNAPCTREDPYLLWGRASAMLPHSG